ncbi:hypothetical protein D3C87_1693200 [compost metagenome]
MPRALRTNPGMAWARVLAAMSAFRLVLAGNPGVNCAISLSRSPFMSGASVGFCPPSSFASRNSPLLASAWARPLGVLSW